MREAARRLARGERAFGGFEDRRVGDAGVGRVEGGAVDGNFAAQHLPDGLVEEVVGIGDDGCHGIAQFAERCAVGGDLGRPVGNRPMHFGKTVELRGDLLLPVALAVAEESGRGLAGKAQGGGADGRLDLPRQRFGPVFRDDGEEFVRQRRRKQRVGVGGRFEEAGVGLFKLCLPRFAVAGALRFFEQPGIDGGEATQLRKDQRVGADLAGEGLETFPDQRREQVRAGPQIGGRARLGDEALHRAEAHREQRRRVVGMGAGERRDEVEVVPDRMIRNAGVGRQHLPQQVEFGGRGFRAEAPEGEEGQPGVVAAKGDEALEVVEADGLERVDMGVDEVLLDPEAFTRERMDDCRIMGEPHL